MEEEKKDATTPPVTPNRSSRINVSPSTSDASQFYDCVQSPPLANAQLPDMTPSSSPQKALADPSPSIDADSDNTANIIPAEARNSVLEMGIDKDKAQVNIITGKIDEVVSEEKLEIKQPSLETGSSKGVAAEVDESKESDPLAGSDAMNVENESSSLIAKFLDESPDTSIEEGEDTNQDKDADSAMERNPTNNPPDLVYDEGNGAALTDSQNSDTQDESNFAVEYNESKSEDDQEQPDSYAVNRTADEEKAEETNDMKAAQSDISHEHETDECENCTREESAEDNIESTEASADDTRNSGSNFDESTKDAVSETSVDTTRMDALAALPDTLSTADVDEVIEGAERKDEPQPASTDGIKSRNEASSDAKRPDNISTSAKRYIELAENDKALEINVDRPSSEHLSDSDEEYTTAADMGSVRDAHNDVTSLADDIAHSDNEFDLETAAVSQNQETAGETNGAMPIFDRETIEEAAESINENEACNETSNARLCCVVLFIGAATVTALIVGRAIRKNRKC